MSAAFAKTGLDVRAPDVAASDLLRVIDGLTPKETGGFFDYKGEPLLPDKPSFKIYAHTSENSAPWTTEFC